MITRNGAYGFAVEDDDLGSALPGLQPVPDDWPVVRVTREVADDPLPERELTDTHAVFRILYGGWMRVDRDPVTARYRTPAAIDPPDIAHPYLAPVAAAFAHWWGQVPLHGGAVVIDGRAWGLLGPKEGGKSTLLAHLALAGYDIVSDDVLVVASSDGEPWLFAGPRSVDLRPEAAQRYPNERVLASVRSGDRSRLELGATDLRVPLAGFFLLDWGRELSTEPVAVSERLLALGPHRAFLSLVPPARLWLEVATLPIHRVIRPRAWDSQDDVAAALVAAASR